VSRGEANTAIWLMAGIIVAMALWGNDSLTVNLNGTGTSGMFGGLGGMVSQDGLGDIVYTDPATGQEVTSHEEGFSMNTREIHRALELLTNKSLDYSTTAGYISSLHIKGLARDDIDARTLIAAFDQKNTGEGWATVGVVPYIAPGVAAYLAAWTLAPNARAVIAGEGALVSTYYGYDVVYLTSYGPDVTYAQFANFIRTS